MTLGKWLQRQRKHRGWTLREVAELTGLSIGYIWSIENEGMDIPISTAEKLTGIFDIPLWQVLRDLEDETP